MFYFHQVPCVHYLGEVNIFCHVCVKRFLLFTTAQKLLKIGHDLPELWSQNNCHFFMVHSVYCRNKRYKLSLLIATQITTDNVFYRNIVN